MPHTVHAHTNVLILHMENAVVVFGENDHNTLHGLTRKYYLSISYPSVRETVEFHSACVNKDQNIEKYPRGETTKKNYGFNKNEHIPFRFDFFVPQNIRAFCTIRTLCKVSVRIAMREKIRVPTIDDRLMSPPITVCLPRHS